MRNIDGTWDRIMYKSFEANISSYYKTGIDFIDDEESYWGLKLE